MATDTEPDSGPRDPDPLQSDPLQSDPLLAAAPMLEGFRVLDPAVLYAKIGEGGMGAVYRGRHVTLDLDVAVKCLRPELATSNADFIRRFEQEAKLAASINHQNVVRVMHVQQKNGIHYLVMEYVAGETAMARVRRKGCLAEAEALAILTGAASGLAEAHGRGIVHRDIKPENIMISTEGRVKLADLGLAKALAGTDGRSLSMHTSMIMGTPAYMPPEQWDTPAVGPAADVWALGATLYCLLHGGPAFSGPLTRIMRAIQDHDFPSLREARPDVRSEVHALLERCVQRDPAARFADAGELLRALRRFGPEDEARLVDPESGTLKVSAATVTPPPRKTLLRIRAKIEQQQADEPEGRTMPTRAQPQRRRRAWPAVAVVALIGAGLVGWRVLAGADGQPPERPPTGDPGALAERSPQPRAPQEPVPGRPASPDPGGALAACAKGRRNLEIGEPDAAVACYLEARQLDPDLPEAVDGLIAAYLARAQRLVATNLDAALVDLREAVRIAPQNETATGRLASAERSLRNRLLQCVALGSPDPRAPGVVQSNPEIVVEGTVGMPSPQNVEVALTAADAPDEAAWRPVVWPGGTFRTSLTAPGDGRWFVHLRATDLSGVQASPQPVAIVVDGQPPAIDWDAPADGAVSGRRVEIRGRLRDASACTLTANGVPVAVDADGAWRKELELAAGGQAIVLEAVDAAGTPTRQRREVRIDVAGPTIELDAVVEGVAVRLPGGGEVLATRRGVLSLSGRVVDEAGVAALRLGDQAIAFDEGSGAFRVEVATATGAPTAVRLVAEDRLGQRGELELRVQRVTEAPRAIVDVPREGDLVAVGDLEVQGRLATGELPLPIAQLTVAGRPVPIEGGEFRATVPIRADAAGRTAVAIAVSVRDSLGNTRDSVRQVTVVVLADQYVTENGIRLARVKAGQFVMGSPPNERGRRPNEDQVRVAIGADYWLGCTEVTQRAYREIMGEAPWQGSSSVVVGPEVAAACIGWAEAVEFCRRLTARERAAGRLPPGHEFALPTEAEWEMACRAGSEQAYCFGDDPEQLGTMAVYNAQRGNFGGTDVPRVVQVATKKPNPWGFFDMHGNVKEWCADRVPSSESSTRSSTGGPLQDPVLTTGERRVLRGGSYFLNAEACRCACRDIERATLAEPQTGFRVALVSRPVK